jgi:hypothetical protein
MFQIKVAEKIETHFMLWLLFENRAVYEIMSKTIVEPGRSQTIWRLRVTYWISKPTSAQAHARPRALAPPTKTHTRTHARMHTHVCPIYIHKVVQIWPGQTVTCLHTNRPGHIWTTLYFANWTFELTNAY